MADTAIDFALSNFVAKNNESYRADPADLADIADCWGELAGEHDWNIGPEATLVFLYLMVYGPLVKQAIADRKMAELEQRQNDFEARLKLMEQLQKTQGNAAADNTHQPDTAGLGLA